MKELYSYPATNFDTEVEDASFKIQPLQMSEGNNSGFSTLQNNIAHFKIIWIVKGQGSLWIDNYKCDIEDNQLFYIKPGQIQGFQSDQGLEGYSISFTESFIDRGDRDSDSLYSILFQMFSNTHCIVVSKDTMADMIDITERMLKEFNNTNLFRAEILRRYFKIFLIYLTRQFEGALEPIRQTRNNELLQQFMSLLEKNFRTQKMVADYAGQLLVTPNYLNEVVKKITGNSAGHHIRQRVALEAKRKASYSNSCMKEIAYYLGFYDIAHFSKFFKNTTGKNFSDFKKESYIISNRSLLLN
jgi:YesN/AraC family two-component response regulator